MKFTTTDPAENPAEVAYKRCTVDFQTGEMVFRDVPCRNPERCSWAGFGPLPFRNLGPTGKEPTTALFANEKIPPGCG